jgi:predicted esterase
MESVTPSLLLAAVMAVAGCDTGGELPFSDGGGTASDGGTPAGDGSGRDDEPRPDPSSTDGGPGDSPRADRGSDENPPGDGLRSTCGSGGPETGDGFERVDLTSSHYLVAAPSSPGPHPVVISLHGDGSGARNGAMTTWMSAWRPRKDFILVAPESPTGGPSWRLGDQEANIGFLIDVLNDVSRNHDVDVHRIYVQGFSGGSTFLGWFGFVFQDVFAGMALHCGGWSLERANYDLPDERCRTPARFVISDDDFLRGGARRIHDDLQGLGHEVDWVDADCSGHCCGNQSRFVAESLEWFLGRAKCGGGGRGGCGRIDDLP